LCLGRSSTDRNRYLIQWEGYEADVIDDHGVRSLDLRVGDQIKVNLQGFAKVSHIIRGFKDKTTANAESGVSPITDVYGHKVLLVAPKQRKSLPVDVSTEPVREVPVSAVYLDSNMWGQMKERVYEYTAPAQTVSGVSTPIGRACTPSSPPSRSRRGHLASAPPPASTCAPVVPPDGMFRNMAFAISHEDAGQKTKLAEVVQRHGGVVLDSFMELLEADSTRLKPQFSPLTFTALLADRHSRKEKYMQALALGVPCLSGRWVDACVRSNGVVEWSTYLLPAGESTELDGATRSRVMPPGPPPVATNVRQMIAARPNMLADSRVVVVVGRGKVEVRRRPYLFLIQALGAGRIDTAPDLPSAMTACEEHDDPPAGPVEYVFVPDRDVETARALFAGSSASSAATSTDKGRAPRNPTQARRRRDPDLGGGPLGPSVRVMGNEDIVQSLVLGRLWRG
jgi:hypothetical protein